MLALWVYSWKSFFLSHSKNYGRWNVGRTARSYCILIVTSSSWTAARALAVCSAPAVAAAAEAWDSAEARNAASLAASAASARAASARTALRKWLSVVLNIIQIRISNIQRRLWWGDARKIKMFFYSFKAKLYDLMSAKRIL